MVHRQADSRLLANLLSTEKDYLKQLDALLKSNSSSLASFSAYASASSPPTSQIITQVAGAFAGADEALLKYANAVDAWRNELDGLKALEEEVNTVIRDKDILIGRLIKASKSQKPTRDSLLGNQLTPLGSSTLSLGSDHSAGPNSKLGQAQAELQACEAYLTEKERELAERRFEVIRQGLSARAKAMVECGWQWGEMGKEALRALESPDASSSRLSGSLSRSSSLARGPFERADVDKPLPGDPAVKQPSDISSVTPSQSASNRDGVIPASRHTLPRRITEESLNQHEDDSSDEAEDSNDLVIVENPQFSNAQLDKRSSVVNSRLFPSQSALGSSTRADTGPYLNGLARERKNSRTGFLGTLRGFFRGSNSQKDRAYNDDDDDRDDAFSSSRSPMTGGSNGKWATRTDANLKATKKKAKRQARASGNDDSSDDDVAARTHLGVGGSAGVGLASGSNPAVPPLPRATLLEARSVSASNTPASGTSKKKLKRSETIGAGPSTTASAAPSTPLPSPSGSKPRPVRSQSDHSTLSKKDSVSQWVSQQSSQSLTDVRDSHDPPLPSPSLKSAANGNGILHDGNNPPTPSRKYATASTNGTGSKAGSSGSQPMNRRNSLTSTVSAPVTTSGSGRQNKTNGGGTVSRSSSLRDSLGGVHGHARGGSYTPETNLMTIVEDMKRMNMRQVSGSEVLPRAPPAISRSDIEAALRVDTSATTSSRTRNSPPRERVPPHPDLADSPTRTRNGVAGENRGSLTSSSSPALLSPHAPSKSPSPLRSALRNSSRTPSPIPPLPGQSSPSFSAVMASAPRSVSPVRKVEDVIPSPLPPPVLSPIPIAVDRKGKKKEDDVSSLSSYETGHEVLEEEDTEREDNNVVEGVISTSASASASTSQSRPVNGLLSISAPPPLLPPSPPAKDSEGLDGAAVSDGSTVSIHAAQQQQQPEGEGEDQTNRPARRKSVRYSERPTYAPTPPAIEEDESEHVPWSGGGNVNSWSTSRDAAEEDMWKDSSEEDEDYAKAKKKLVRVGKKAQGVLGKR